MCKVKKWFLNKFLNTPVPPSNKDSCEAEGSLEPNFLVHGCRLDPENGQEVGETGGVS